MPKQAATQFSTGVGHELLSSAILFCFVSVPEPLRPGLVILQKARKPFQLSQASRLDQIPLNPRPPTCPTPRLWRVHNNPEIVWGGARCNITHKVRKFGRVNMSLNKTQIHSLDMPVTPQPCASLRHLGSRQAARLKRGLPMLRGLPCLGKGWGGGQGSGVRLASGAVQTC